MKTLLVSMIAAVALFCTPAFAKGLDDLQPTDKKDDGSGKKDDSQFGATDDLQPNKNPNAPPPVEAAPAQNTAPKPQGKLSKALSDKLHISASYGFVRIPKTTLGSFNAQGMADITFQWNFIDATANNYKVMITGRYAPIHSENEIDGQSYRSIIEGYHLGGQFRYRFLHKDLELVAGAELGYLLVYQESRDKYPVQEDSENNELAYTVHTGFEWVLMDKISVGPRLYAGFGNIQIVQASAAATFTF